MRELTRAMMEYSWAMSLFGARQFENLLLPRGRRGDPTDEAAASLYTVSVATQNQFDSLLQGAFQAGDQLQRGIVDVMFDLLTFKSFDPDNPNNLQGLSADATQQTEETFRVLISERNIRLAWRELQNKLRVFQMVQDARTTLKITSETYIPLLESVRRAYDAGPYPALWLIEGLGHDYTDTFWNRGETPRDILTQGIARRLPGKSLTMLHAGLGLSIAQRLLKDLTPQSSPREARSVIREFIELCDANAREGYVGAAYESLGLVTRTFFPPLVGVVERALRELDEEVLAYFWHGVGRALYFSAVYFIPGLLSPWIALDREAPYELARLNVVAGITWAIVEVNINDPEVMENTLRFQGERISHDGAFANGVSSGVIMRYDTTPDADFTFEWCRHEPDGSDPDLARLWRRQVSGPCRDALEWFYPVLKRRGRLGEVFRYQPLRDLVEELEW
ncbi:MAG: hypothetical protein H0T60_15980 [Acidobacteria bacterium]|nr:hypothetical protein [Acidobacteriota bacterium]